jgi:transposase
MNQEGWRRFVRRLFRDTSGKGILRTSKRLFEKSWQSPRLIKAEGCELRIVKRRKRAFEVVGLTWIVERTFAWIGRYRRMSKDYEHRVQTSETLIDLIAIRLMLNRLTKS